MVKNTLRHSLKKKMKNRIRQKNLKGLESHSKCNRRVNVNRIFIYILLLLYNIFMQLADRFMHSL